MRRLGRAAGVLIGATLVTGACGPAPTATAASVILPIPTATATAVPTLTVEIRTATLGLLWAQTVPGAVCLGKVVLPSGAYRIAADFLNEKTATAEGLARWSYPANAREHGPTIAIVSCTLGEQMAEAREAFEIP